jgi:hypothetical protein
MHDGAPSDVMRMGEVVEIPASSCAWGMKNLLSWRLGQSSRTWGKGRPGKLARCGIVVENPS